jgi:hypothetical protein
VPLAGGFRPVLCAVAGGWFQRAQRLLAEQPEGPEHGFLAWAATMFARAPGPHDGALQAAQQAFDLGRRFGVADLQALGLVFQGYILVRQGKVDEGLLLMDEGMTWAVDGQLAPTSSAVIFCRTIDTCYALGDYRRASEWMEAIADCFARTGIEAFPGDCEAHSVGILVGRGAWSEGERRARRTCAAIEPMDLTHAGLALAEIGEIRLAGAISPAPRRRSPGPRSWDRHHIRVWRWSGSRRAMCVGPWPRSRSPWPTSPGTVWVGHGCCPPRWRSRLPTVMRWRAAGAPYEAARARLLLGEALERHGDRRHALVELDAARAAFESLGATLDLQRAARLLAAT